MPVLRPSSSDFTSFVKAAAQYVAPGRTAKVSKSGGVSVALPGLGAVVRTSQVGALASPSTSAVIINGVTPRPAAAAAAAAAAVFGVLLGIVTTLAGSGVNTFANGTGALASFGYPSGVAVIPSSGVIVVADHANHRIRLVTPGGVVSTLAGSGTPTFADGTGTGASFVNPNGVAFIPSTNTVVVADTYNNRIRLITYPGGVVSTLAGQSVSGSADGTGAAASFNLPFGVAVHPSGLIVVADEFNDRIRLVDPTSGLVTTLAGSSKGYGDGTGAAASFNGPSGVTVIPASGVIVVADTGNKRIRLVTYPGGVVTTLAGSGDSAFADGTGTGASFKIPKGVTIDSLGNIIVADTINQRIRRITYPEGVVTTLAGSGTATFADGTGAGASFNAPTGVALNPLTGAIVVGDQDNHRIRVMT